LAKRKNNAEAAEASRSTVGYEARLWQIADALRGSMEAAEYKHVVLGLIFLFAGRPSVFKIVALKRFDNLKS